MQWRHHNYQLPLANSQSKPTSNPQQMTNDMATSSVTTEHTKKQKIPHPLQPSHSRHPQLPLPCKNWFQCTQRRNSEKSPGRSPMHHPSWNNTNQESNWTTQNQDVHQQWYPHQKNGISSRNAEDAKCTLWDTHPFTVTTFHKWEGQWQIIIPHTPKTLQSPSWPLNPYTTAQQSTPSHPNGTNINHQQQSKQQKLTSWLQMAQTSPTNSPNFLQATHQNNQWHTTLPQQWNNQMSQQTTTATPLTPPRINLKAPNQHPKYPANITPFYWNTNNN